MIDKLIYKIFEGLFLSGKESFFKYLMFFRQKSRYIFFSVLRYLSIEGRRSKVEGRRSKVEAQRWKLNLKVISHSRGSFTLYHADLLKYTLQLSVQYSNRIEAVRLRFGGFEVLRS